VGPSGRETVRDWSVVKLRRWREDRRTKRKRTVSHGPIDEKLAPGLVDLAERLMWTVEAAARTNRITIKSA